MAAGPECAHNGVERPATLDRREDIRVMLPLIAIACLAATADTTAPRQASERAPTHGIRTIATTDGEIDDRCSMVRFLLYANEFDVRGIVISSSRYHWKGNARVKASRWEGEEWLGRQLDAYARVYPNLKRHDRGYPPPEHLRRVSAIGNVETEGDMSGPTPGSRLIVAELLNNDPRPIWLQAWGGPNTIAQALKTIEEEHPDRRAEVTRKARLYLIEEQDDTYRTYIAKRWPDLLTISSRAFPAIAYGWRDLVDAEDHAYFDGAWMKRNILDGHGPLCAMYEAREDGSFISEGDSPAFMHLIDVGLASHMDPSYGGWGGRFQQDGTLWVSARDDRDMYRTILRWAQDFQNDWAARADWCVRPYAEANHAPLAVCNGDRTKNPVRVRAKPGATVKLSAAGSSDPDRDKLTYGWQTYKEACTYWADVPVRNARTASASLTVPPDASGRTIHIILRVSDNGNPPLVAYRRVVIQVSGDPKPAPADGDTAYLNTPVRKLSGPPGSTGPWTFYRGININGPAITVDGNRWDSDEAPDYACSDTPLNVTGVTLRPATDPAREQMIRSFRWSGEPRIRVTGVPGGTYAVYAYIWEDNNPETFRIMLNGKQVVARHISGVTGEWRRAGPWVVDVQSGAIEISTRGGAANFSGIEIWKRGK
ncbi:MAG: DUF1593 domain-containing protein [Armatimonadetes bacterium]|nr:DUF1593 domain-containing protein [Armatimonadota bacterium]